MQPRRRFILVVIILAVVGGLYAVSGGIVYDASGQFSPAESPRVTKNTFDPIMVFKEKTRRITILPFLLYYQTTAAETEMSIALLTRAGQGDAVMNKVRFSTLSVEYDDGSEQVVFPSTTRIQYSTQSADSQPLWLRPDEATLRFTKMRLCQVDDVNCYSLLGPIVLPSRRPLTLKISGEVFASKTQQRRFFFKQRWQWQANSKWRFVNKYPAENN